jgi:hypothetical protein
VQTEGPGKKRKKKTVSQTKGRLENKKLTVSTILNIVLYFLSRVCSIDLEDRKSWLLGRGICSSSSSRCQYLHFCTGKGRQEELAVGQGPLQQQLLKVSVFVLLY